MSRGALPRFFVLHACGMTQRAAAERAPLLG